MRALVTGATGYVGGRLAPRLAARGHDVRCLTRSAARLRDVPWAGDVEIVEGDVADPASLENALRDADVVYYLVHSLGRKGFEKLDRDGATNIAEVAARTGVKRIVYLGGPDPADPNASAHLRSRHEVAEILLKGAVPAVVLRAPVIIGSGSASFEMLRYLTERLPAMVCPRWVRNRIQPIAIRDVLHYLIGMGEIDDDVDRAFDIGGPDVLTYEQMMRRYARVAGLRKRLIVPTRFLSPTLSSLWVGLVTPVPNAIARPLVGSLVHEAVAREHDIARFVPDPDRGLTGFDEAVRLALTRIRDADVETRWTGSSWPGTPAAEPLPTDPNWSGGTVYTDQRESRVDASPEELWRVITAIGGETGWYSFPLAWAVRGWLDRAVGGVGLRRGRRDPHRLYLGEAVDFWRVEEIVPGEMLRLRAEMRLPGRAWLEMRAMQGDAAVASLGDKPAAASTAVYCQRAVFLPRGLAGHAYWAAVWPFHSVIFGGMSRNIAKAAAATRPAPAARSTRGGGRVLG
ncbi:SDR family oxidoreductase [Virgisporangium aurantiacum]|nr:SDR family oxidoreductase [Virgisporangium aurantiacum]